MKNKYWMPTPPEDLLKMNLQLFGGEDENLGSGDEDEADDTDEQENGQGESSARKSFTDEELSKFVAKSTKKAMAKFLREIGFTPGAETDTVKERLLGLAKFEEGQKTNLEKANGTVSTLTQERDNASARALMAERKLEAIRNGVPADKVDRYIKLAESYMDDEDDDFAEAVKAALKDFPAVQQEHRGSAGAGANPPPEKKGKKTEANAGQEAAQRRREQMKRSQDALKNYTGK